MRIRDVAATALVSIVVVLVAAAPTAGRKPVPKDLPEPVSDALDALEDTALKERIVRTLAATRSSPPR